MKKTKIALSYPGLVVFDPEVIKTFMADHHVDTPNLLDAFVHDAALGQEATSTGCLLPIYSVQPWDYTVVLTEGAASSLPANWIRFQSPPFVLQVRSGRVIISDIWAIMNWDEEFYCNYEAYPLDPNYAAVEAQVSDSAELPNGRYRVVVVGFCEPGNSDPEQRQCGYELLLTPDADATFGVVGSIDGIDFNVLPESV